jgi:hypothetical protein
MSWSICLIGSPDNVVKEIESHSGTLQGQCKLEFDAAKPHLIGLVKENFNADPAITPPTIKLEASGSGYAVGDIQRYRNCKVSIDSFYHKLV